MSGLKIYNIFSDNMVIQRNEPFFIWGTGNENDTVRVSLGINQAETIVHDGRWELSLPPMEALNDCELIIISNDETIILEHVAIGEVWVAGGQSNMEFQMKYDWDLARFLHTKDDLLRFFDVPSISYEGQENEEDFSSSGKWINYNSSNIELFSAVGFYFAKMLREHINIPVGIIGCNRGGTPAQTWLDETKLIEDDELKHYWLEYEEEISRLDLIEYKKKFKTNRNLSKHPLAIQLFDIYMRGNASMETLAPYLEKIPPDILAKSKEKLIAGPLDQGRPGGLFHTMVKKIAGYSVKGILWYQGEGDSSHAMDYSKLFGYVIDSWREAWKKELPFIFVQIAPFENDFFGESGDNFPEIRRQQQKVAENLPDTYMISVMDSGEKNNIHPNNKRVVGERLAFMALGEIYGFNIPHCHPQVSGFTIHDDIIEIEFMHTNGKLELLGSIINGLKIFTSNGELLSYETDICNNKLHIRNAKDATRISYATQPYVEVNLFSQAGFPVLPFDLNIMNEKR